MAQPVWQTPAGSLGVIPEGVFFQQILRAPDPDGGDVYFRVVAGTVPDGIQISNNGEVVGVPRAIAKLQGVPLEVARDVTSKFTVRAYTVDNQGNPVRIADRTFTLTITGNDVPQFVTPAGSIGIFYDSDRVEYQIQYTGTDPNEVNIVRLVAGALPGGLTISETGLITGYIEPTPNVDAPPGYDLTPQDEDPYDFVVSAISKNFQFTLEVTDRKSSNLRTFEMYVFDRASLTADNTPITSDETEPTADQTPIRAPFLTNELPSDLGRFRSDNYFAYQFIGDDYDALEVVYAISVNEGLGLPPGLQLDPTSGWYYGYIPDQGTTEVTYSFNITVYQPTTGIDAFTVTATSGVDYSLTCSSVEGLDTGVAVKFSGTGFGNVSTSDTTIYYVLTVDALANTITIGENANSTSPVMLVTASGTMTGEAIVVSQAYPFTLTLTGALDSEVTWLTPADLGSIENGATSTLKIEAVNRGGAVLSYRLLSGAFNELPQGLELLPTGEIAGRVSFNTFAIDLGSTTFDASQSTVTDIQETTWDSTFIFNVNAYAEDTQQILYRVESINVVDGGIGYSSGTPPTILFSAPVGATAERAEAGAVTISGGVIQAVALQEAGGGYTSTATITITEGFGGTGAELTANMLATGARDVISVSKQFTLRLIRAYNKPYQNLYVQAMPPENDRALIAELLTNPNIFVPDYLYRPDDPNFGLSTRVVYQHAFGLEPDILDQYVASLYLNHYWKNLVLGPIQTAVARDADDNIIYEVVYSTIVDNLVNNAGESVSKIVALPYPIIDPGDGSTVVDVVYPNSLVNMRDQVIDVVGQMSTKLPLWMVSKQTNGRVLGFTPAWVICYTQPGRANQIAYYIQTQFGERLNNVDFKVDRYILDALLSRNWDTETQQWTPEPNLTTFDRFNTAGYTFIGYVDIATNLAFADVNQRSLSYIAALGGLDGNIQQINGDTIIFVKQENYDGPPGSSYPTTADAWQNYLYPFDSGGFDATGEAFDEATLVPNFPTNERMAIYTIAVDPVTTIVTLTLTQQPVAFNWVQINRGNEYQSAQLYYPSSPGPNLTQISWLPLVTVVENETLFDGGSVAFEEPVDMYDPTDRYDKYLVFPKANILV